MENKIKKLEEKLLRKEQEYEELRQYHNKCCEEFEKEKKEWLEKYNQVSRDFYNGKYCNKENCSLLKAKEQECEELKEQLQKYRSAFEEIREDMEQDTTCESRECGCDDYAECLNCIKETILNKISECEVGNEEI